MSRHSDVMNNSTARNILSLEQRISVIREYEETPVYQQIAYKYKCSTKQIKNIIANQELILQSYISQKSNGSGGGETKKQRMQKITFLGKVMYEYIQRAQCHSNAAPLTANTIRCKALEVKEIIKVPNFYPNNAWMNNFKEEYGITDFDLAIHRTDKEPNKVASSLNVKNIISYVSSREQHNNDESNSWMDSSYGFVAAQYDDASGGGDDEVSEAAVTYEVNRNSDHHNNGPNNNVISLESEDDDDDGDGSNTSGPPPKIQKVESIATPAEVPVTNYDEALKRLKPLEDFALLEENYRAIGLIAQLEKVFRNFPKQLQD